MKKITITLTALVAIAAVAGGYVYSRNERMARAMAEGALSDFRAGSTIDDFTRPVEPEDWVERVRTSDVDGATDLRNAWLHYRKKDASSGSVSSAPDTDGEPAIALFESAGASASCNLTGGVVPIADNPFETEVPAGSNLLAIGKLMVEKAKALEAGGLQEDAERELLLLLSVGAHLEHDYSLSSFALGLAIQKSALEAMHEIYSGRGREWDAEAARADALRTSAEGRRMAISKASTFMQISLSSEGRRALEGIAIDTSLEKAIRVEAIMALNAGYLFHINRVVLGPEADRITIVEGLRLEDPVLAEITAKAQKAILHMSFADRTNAVSAAHELN